MISEMNLQIVHPSLSPHLEDGFQTGRPWGFVLNAGGQYKELRSVAKNVLSLKKRGIYEEALILANTGARTNHHKISQSTLDVLFVIADKRLLLEAGHAIPDLPEYQIYRGIAGHGCRRRAADCAIHQFVELVAWLINRLRLESIIIWYPWNPVQSTLPAPASKQSVNRDLLAKAKFYQSLQDSGVIANQAALARYLGTSWANITHVLRYLHLSSSPLVDPSTCGEEANPPQAGSATSS